MLVRSTRWVSVCRILVSLVFRFKIKILTGTDIVSAVLWLRSGWTRARRRNGSRPSFAP